MPLNATVKLRWIQIAVYSAGDTITRDQALAVIAGFFKSDPGARLHPMKLPELLALVEPPRPRRARRRPPLLPA